MEQIVTENDKILPRASEVAHIVEIVREDSLGEGAKKSGVRINELYVGTGRERFQQHINACPTSSMARPAFNSTNKPQISHRCEPIEASVPMHTVEVDLVDMRAYQAQHQGKTYSYALSVIDVFPM